MKALIVDESGNKPVMAPGEYPDPEPGVHDLLVRIEATALNRADLMQKAGRYPVPEGASLILGLEMAGVVEQAGSRVTRFKPGDHVFGLLSGGGYAQRCVIHEDMAIRMPDSFSFEEAAAIPEVFLTGWQALVWLGEVKQAEHVLIHAGASGVGSAAIQLAKVVFGCRVATTAGQADKLDSCRKLGADLAVNYRAENFAEAIAAATGEESIDLVIDFVGAPYWEKNMQLLGLDARLVYLAFLGGVEVDHVNLLAFLRKRLTVRGSTLRNRSEEYKIHLTREFWDRTGDLFLQGRLKPVIDSVFDWHEVEKAHERMENNLNIGKIVLTGM